MSFSFNVTAANKAEAKAAVEASVAEIVAQQECHVHDQAAINAVVGSYVDLLSSDGPVSISVSGSVGWSGESGTKAKFTSAGINVSLRSVDG